MSNAPTTTTQGLELPSAGGWEIDPSHSTLGFSVRHLMVSKVRGRFASFSGRIDIGEDPAATAVEVRIDAASIDTRAEDRDNHLRSPDFFDVERFPTLSFRSTGVEHVDGSRWKLHGDLTIRDVTRPVTLDVEYAGLEHSPWGQDRIGFEASTEIARDDFGLTWNQALESGGVVVGKRVRLEFDVEAFRAS
jgi:polyisoprenoid-binding protein YceI